ncbi:MAG: heme-binding protein [Methanomicrobiales archaeon]
MIFSVRDKVLLSAASRDKQSDPFMSETSITSRGDIPSSGDYTIMADTISYDITGKEGTIEYRHYPAMVLATVDSPGNDTGFNLLFAYISGSNKARSKIPMTSPVINSRTIPLTAPVISGAMSMSFVMPAGKPREEIPDPLDGRVWITTLPEREIAVIRFRGYASQQEVDGTMSLLQEGLKKAGIAAVGQPFLMRYNPPWTPGFLRRNEVGNEIRR